MAIDPFQEEVFKNEGLDAVTKCELPPKFTFLNEYDTLALPRMVGEGQKKQFIFIDGSHTFDYTLLDAFYGDQLLEVGGILAFDDIGWPAVQKAVLFFLTNRYYRLLRFSDEKFSDAGFWRVMFLQKLQEDDPKARDHGKLFTF